MSRKWLVLWCILVGVFVVSSALAQDQVDPRKWTQDLRSTRLQPTENFVAPRQDPNYVPPKQVTRVFTTPKEILTVTPNVRVHPSTTTSQSEVPITRHPTNGNILYASSNAVHFSPSLFISEGMYLSSDGGATWFGSDTTNALPLSEHSGDPAPAIGPDGRLYMSEITSGMGVEYSTNMGATWSNIYQLISGSMDKNHTFVNDVPASPYYGRAFVTWSNFTASAPPAVVFVYIKWRCLMVSGNQRRCSSLRSIPARCQRYGWRKRRCIHLLAEPDVRFTVHGPWRRFR
jgi:hypothetical protein